MRLVQRELGLATRLRSLHLRLVQRELGLATQLGNQRLPLMWLWQAMLPLPAILPVQARLRRMGGACSGGGAEKGSAQEGSASCSVPPSRCP